MKPIGVLGLQGDFAAHIRSLDLLNVPALLVRKGVELAAVSALIIPGGESTTLLKLAAETGLVEALKIFHQAGRPIFGTCAGAILLAKSVTAPVQQSLDLIDIDIERNAYGRHAESFETERILKSAQAIDPSNHGVGGLRRDCPPMK